MNNEIGVVAAVGIVMLIGLFGTMAPLVPGLPLIWAAALFYGFQTEWDALASIAMVIVTMFMVAGVLAKIVLPSRRVSQTGAPRSTLFYGGVGGFIGFFIIPVIGLPVGAVTGVLLAEYRRTDDWQRAWSSTKGAIIGFGIGTLIEVAAGVAMAVTWVVWVLAD